MRFYLNPDEYVFAIRNSLNADSTLQNSSYLNGTVNIFTNRLPKSSPARTLLIESLNPIPNMMQSYFVEIRIHCHVPLLFTQQINPISNIILARCEFLLNNKTLTIVDAVTDPLTSLGIISSYFEENEKSHGILRLQTSIHPY